MGKPSFGGRLDHEFDDAGAIADVEELTHTFTGQPSGETLEVCIVPANATGDGHSSPSAATAVP